MRISHCIWALAALLAAAAPARAQGAAAPTRYTIFVNGAPAGGEDISIRSDATGTTIVSEGRTAQGTALLRRVEIRYDADWSPERFDLEGSINNNSVELHTAFKDGVAVTQGVADGKPVASQQKVSPRTIIMANGTFAGFAAMPQLLARSAPGQELRVFLLPTAEVGARLAAITDDRMQTGTSLFDVRRYEMILADPGGNLAINLTTATDGSLVRVSIPSQRVEILRDDIASAVSRIDVYSNRTDQAVVIPAQGFNLGATITLPAGAASAAAGKRVPAVVLAAGTRAPDRDTLLPGVTTMAQLAGSLAEAGFLVVRYDRRGSGQSGGRPESSALSDYAEDIRAIVKWLGARKDVDAKRIAVVGHGEGAWMALLAASKDKRIAAVASLEGPGTTGSELVLEQQQHQLNEANTPAADRETRVALQKKIHSAVMTGKGWDQLTPEVRKRADTPWFHSLLAFDPAKVLEGVEVPILIVHGQLDGEIPVAHAERLADAARKGDSESVELVSVRGVNHLLLPAFTGEVREYASLTDRTISGDVTSAVSAWLTKTLPEPTR